MPQIKVPMNEGMKAWAAFFRSLSWKLDENYSHMAGFKGTGKYEGWVAQFYANPGRVMIWGGDGLSIETPSEPSEEGLIAALSRCNYCGATGIEPVRLGFAGRACAGCRERLAPDIERPGWTE